MRATVPKLTATRGHALPQVEYDALLAAQGGGCAICGTTPKTRRLHTDRDHKTLAVRGLLCHRCNRMLPAWVTVALLLRCALYLDRTADVLTVNLHNDVADYLERAT